MTAARSALKQMGPSRTTTQEQIRYLLEISGRFQTITELALSAKYVTSDWFDKDVDRRLATFFINRCESLDSDLFAWGHTYQFEKPVPFSPQPRKHSKISTKPLPLANSDGGYEESWSVRQLEADPDLEELEVPETLVVQTARRNIMAWLEETYRDSRGLELGTFDGSLLQMTMKHQCQKWRAIAYGFILDVITNTHTFIKDLLVEICPDSLTRASIQAELTDGILKRYKRAIEIVEFLLETEIAGTPLTVNRHFNRHLQDS